jgi:GNAT superfamily N-acetyltransferase
LRWQHSTTDWPPADGPVAEREAFVAFFVDWTLDHLATHVPFIAEVDGRIAGMAWLMLATRVPTVTAPDRRTGDVQSVFVVPELRNAGVGAALMAAILVDAGNRELELVTVHSADRAVPFYLRAGFKGDQNWYEWRP